MKLFSPSLFLVTFFLAAAVIMSAAQDEEEEECSIPKGLSKKDPSEPRRKNYKKDDKEFRAKVNKMMKENKIKPGKGNKNKNRRARAVEICVDEFVDQLNFVTTFIPVTTECSTLETCDTYCAHHPDCYGFFSLNSGTLFYIYTEEIDPMGWGTFFGLNSYVCPKSENCVAFPDTTFSPSGAWGTTSGICQDPADCEAKCFNHNAYSTSTRQCLGFKYYSSSTGSKYYLYYHGVEYNRWTDMAQNTYNWPGTHSYACGCVGDFRTIDNKVPISSSAGSCSSALVGNLQTAYTDCSSDITCNSVIEYRGSGQYRKCFYTPGIPALTSETNCFFHICNCMDWNTNP